MKHLTFEEFLEDQHAEEYHGTDDNMPDAFEKWLGDLDTQSLIELAEAYGHKLAGI